MTQQREEKYYILEEDATSTIVRILVKLGYSCEQITEITEELKQSFVWRREYRRNCSLTNAHKQMFGQKGFYSQSNKRVSDKEQHDGKGRDRE